MILTMEKQVIKLASGGGGGKCRHIELTLSVGPAQTGTMPSQDL